MTCTHYSIADLGLGHASRARAVIDRASLRGRVVVHAPGESFFYLSGIYAGNGLVQVRRRNAVTFARGSGGAVSLRRSAFANLGLCMDLERDSAALTRALKSDGARLVIGELDPALARAARRTGVPLVTLDHEGLLTNEDLPLEQRHAERDIAERTIARLARLTASGSALTLSTRLRAPNDAVARGGLTPVGVLLRAAVRAERSRRGGYLVAHSADELPQSALEALRAAPMEVRLYGRGSGSREGSLTRRASGDAAFAADLAGAEAYIGDPSTQLIGEALHLDKPVLALPVEGHPMHGRNARAVVGLGAGDRCARRALDHGALERFLARLDDLRRVARGLRVDGTQQLLDTLDARLGTHIALTRTTPAPVSTTPATWCARVAVG